MEKNNLEFSENNYLKLMDTDIIHILKINCATSLYLPTLPNEECKQPQNYQ